MKIQNVWFVIGLLMSTTYLIAQRPSDGIYYIKTVNTAKYLGVEGIDPNNGAALVQWDFSTNDNHKFEVKNLPDGSILLKAMHSQRYLNVEGLSMENNARIIQWDYANQDNLKFELVQDMNGAGYFIQCFQSRKFWHLMGGNNNPQNGIKVVQYAGAGQTFIFEKVNNRMQEKVSPDLKRVKSGKTSLMLRLPFSNKVKAYKVTQEGDNYILNGDIIVSKRSIVGIDIVPGDAVGIVGRQDNLVEGFKWKNATIPVVIDPSIYQMNLGTIVHDGLEELNSKTKLCYVPRTTEVDYVRIIFDGSIAGAGRSYVGRDGGEQLLKLRTGNKFVVAHELLHAAGFYHEQSREDRDKYVRIVEDNILEDLENNFETEEESNLPYDYCSIMHYGPTFFSKNGQPTIQCLSNGATIPCPPCMGAQNALSPLDISGIDAFYSEVSRFPCNTKFSRPGEVAFVPKRPKNSFAIPRTTDQIDIFWAGSDGRVYAAWNKLGETWTNHTYKIPGNYPAPAAGTSIASIERASKQIDIFWIGSDGKIYAAWNRLGETWNNQVYTIAGNYPAPAAGSSVTAIARTANQIDLFWVGSDGKIYAAWNKLGETWDNHVYQIAGNYPAPARNTSISAIPRTNDQIDLYWAGNDGRVYAAWNKFGGTWDNHIYQIPGNYPAPAAGTSIATIARTSNQIDIYWIGNNGKVYAAWNKLGETWDNHVYQIAGNYPVPLAGTSIATVERTGDQVDIYWAGSDGKIYAAWNKLGSTWNNQIYAINGAYPPATPTQIAAINRSIDQVDIFWVNKDGNVYSAWNKLGSTWNNQAIR